MTRVARLVPCAEPGRLLRWPLLFARELEPRTNWAAQSLSSTSSAARSPRMQRKLVQLSPRRGHRLRIEAFLCCQP